MRSQIEGALRHVAAFTPEAFAELGRSVPIEWLDQALQLAPGYAKMRERKMPLDRALWMVVGMGLFADRSIASVVSHLGLALPGGKPGVNPSAIPQARSRLGAEPLEELLRLLGTHWAVQSARDLDWCGLAAFAGDGSTIAVQDTEENEKAFGRPSGRSQAGFPQLQLVNLVAIRSHLVVDSVHGPYGTSEKTLFPNLIERLPPRSITVLDRGFVSWALARAIAERGNDTHFVIRVTKNLVFKKLKKLGPDDWLVEIRLRSDHDKRVAGEPETMVARLLTCRTKGYQPFKVITSAVDADRFPRKAFGELYRQRWEIEISFDEVKNDMLEGRLTLRSKKPAGVRQELAGILVAYNLVRQAMSVAADEIGLDPLRISFRNAVHSVRNFCITAWLSSAGTLPKALIGLESDLRLLVLPPRRTDRRYARTVKVKMSPFKRNRRRGSARLTPRRAARIARNRSGGGRAAI